MSYVQNFKDVEDIINSYGGSSREDLSGAVVHLAWYGYGSYSGQSFGIYEKDGKLYEFHGSHCSCHGLEEQWEPEETTVEALAMRNLRTGQYEGSDEAHETLQAFVKSRQENHAG